MKVPHNSICFPDTTRPLLHFYAADQDWVTTATPGGYHFTAKLIEGLASEPDTGWNIVVSVNPENRTRMIPDDLPDWMQVVEVSGKRLWLDHVWCPFFCLKMKVNAALFPKGWIPIWLPGRVHVQAVLYDCMNDHYAERYPGVIPPLKIRYFQQCTRRTLRRADQLFTISKFSRSELLRRYQVKREIEIMPLGDPLPPAQPYLPRCDRKGLLLLGSSHPHKRTGEALELFQHFRKETGFEEPLYLTGNAEWPDSALHGVERVGRLSDQELSDLYGQVRALILIPDMEGFGLPVLEAYSRGAPVCFRSAHSLQEILGEEAPGAWDGETESFDQTLRQVLSLREEEIHEKAKGLIESNNWEKSVGVLRIALQKSSQGK
ncbi:glycosyltransferase [Kiritimatiellaeota bacterium B1221]|nr:glycosyltransferase [Kiritimatiellaeota bacterium B1221]